MSNYQYPDDEFDAADADGPVPVGVHRAQVPAWRSWIPLLAVLIIVPLVAWGAVALLRHGGAPSSTATSSESGAAPDAPAASPRPADTGDTPAPDASGTPGQQSPDNADLTTGITVHNGTAVSGLAGRTRSKLGNDGFTSVNVADGVYGATDPATTTVFYAAPENASTARAVAGSLGVTNVVESAEEASSNPIVVVLRDDYQE